MFLLGICAALLGNLLIGLGQALQKRAVHQDPLTSNTSTQSSSAGHLWLLGIVLCYAGELGGNWLAMAHVSAAVVAPLGLVSVVVCAVLAERWVGENVGRRQWVGMSCSSGLWCMGVLPSAYETGVVCALI